MAESKSKVCVWMFQMGCLGLFGLRLGKGWKYFVGFLCWECVCVIRMMGIISSELECCWSEMGFHLLKSCRLYTLCRYRNLAPICHTRHLCVWTVYCSEDAVPHCGVWFLHFQPVPAGFLCVSEREMQCFGFGHYSLDRTKCSHLCGFDFIAYPIFSLPNKHKHRASINTPSGCNIVFFFVLSERGIFVLPTAWQTA